MRNSYSNLQTILFLLYTVALSLSASIDLLEPSLITWDNGKSNFTLIAYHFQNIGTQQWKKLNEHFANFQQKDGTFVFSNSYSYTYKPVELIHEASMNFFFKISNGSTGQGVLTGKSYYSNKTSIMLAKDSNLFEISPNIPISQQFQQYISFQMDGDPNIYYIPKQMYSEVPTCNKYLSINEQILLQSNENCQVYPAQRITKQNSYKKIRLLNGPINTSELFLTTDFDLGIELIINSTIKVANLKVYPLSKIQFDLSQVTINVVNFKANGAQKIKVNIQNKGEEFVFIKVSCIQAGESLLSQTILVGAKLSEIIEAALSQISPSSEIIFKITNPVTSEFYLFSTPSSLVQDLSTSTFYFQGSQFTESIGGLSKPAVIGIAISVGISILIVLIGVFIYRRKKKVQKMVSLNLERLRNTCNTVVSTSERQFVNKQIPPIGLMIEDEIPVRKSKQQTSTTIASSTRESIKQETEQKLSQKAASIEEYMQKRNQQMPRIEDKPYQNQQMEDQFITEPAKKVKKPKIYKPGHRRTSSAVQILPAEPDIQSHEQICSSMKRSIQVLQNVQV